MHSGARYVRRGAGVPTTILLLVLPRCGVEKPKSEYLFDTEIIVYYMAIDKRYWVYAS